MSWKKNRKKSYKKYKLQEIKRLMEKNRGVLIQLIALLARIPLTRVIGDEGNGIYSAAFEVYTMLLIISVWCMPTALERMIHVRLTRGQYKNAHHAFKVGFVWNLATSILACLVLVFGADYIAGYLLRVPMSALTIKMLAPSVFIAGFVASLRGYFQGMGTNMPTDVSDGVQQVVAAVASIFGALFLCHYGIKVAHLLHNNSFAAAYAVMGIGVGNFVGLMVSLVFLLLVFFLYRGQRHRLLSKDPTRGSESRGDLIHSMLYILIPLILTSCIYNVNHILDQILYNGVMTATGNGASQVVNFGIYGGKYQVLIRIPIIIASTMWIPLITALEKSYQRVDMRLVRSKVASVYRLTMVIVMPFVVELCLLARPILNMFYRGNITLAAQLLQFGSTLILFYSFAMVGNAILQGMGKYKTITASVLLALVAHVGSLFLMLQYLKLGIFSVVYANIIMSIFMCIFNYIVIRKHIKFTPDWLKTIVIPLFVAVIVGAIALLLYNVLNGSLGSNPALIVAMLISLMAYMALIIAFRIINEKELRSIPGGAVICTIAKMLQLLPSGK